jgi:hypothetical protein
MTVKENVFELSRLSYEHGWSLEIYTNEAAMFDPATIFRDKDYEDCPVSNPLTRPVNSPVLKEYNLCIDLQSDELATIQNLGFGTRNQCFWSTLNPDTGWSGMSGCHIQYNGRELTTEEMWIADMAGFANLAGLNVKPFSGGGAQYFPWGVWGATKDEAWAQVDALIAMGFGGGLNRFTDSGGYIWVPTVCYLPSIYRMASYTPPCECTLWQNAECTELGRRQVRTCTPPGCFSEVQYILDPTCGSPPPSPSVLPLVMLLGAGLVGGVLLMR